MMNRVLFFILLLSIWNSFLFFGNKLGISVILFIVPLLGVILYCLYKKKVIKRKRGFLLIIPIILLSCCYFIFDNSFFKFFNIIVIILLFMFMYIITVRPYFRVFNFFKDCFALLVGPIGCVFDIIEIILEKLCCCIKLSSVLKKRIKSFIFILPIIIIILWLLISADMVFDFMIGGFFRDIGNLLLDIFEWNLFVRVILIFIVFLYISSSLYFVVNDYLEFVPESCLKNKEDDSGLKKFRLDVDTVKILFIILSIIYVLFDVIQIKSLIFHSVSYDINYSEYARQGFFQLMVVSFINLFLLLFSKKYYNDDKGNVRFFKFISLLIIGLTFVIIVSSFMRMNLYESHYGYTFLRLLVYIVLITEIIMLIPTVIYILRDNYNVFWRYFVIIICVYVITNYINIDYVIAYRNVDRYYEVKDIDLKYLENGGADNLSVLFEFYSNVKDKEIKSDLEEYFSNLNLYDDGFQEFNLSRNRGNNLIKKLK